MDVKLNEHTSEFMADFFAFGPAVELLKTVGRNVSGAHFDHSTSSVFQGTYLVYTRRVAVRFFQCGLLALEDNGAMKTGSRGTTVEPAFLRRVCSRFIHLGTPISPIGTRVL